MIQEIPMFLRMMAVLLVANFGAHQPADAQSIQDVGGAIGYVQQLNQLSQQYSEVINQTVEIDNLSFALSEQEISADFAERQALLISVRLKHKIDISDEQRAKLPKAPLIENPQLANSILNTQKMLAEIAQMASTSLQMSMEILQETLQGNFDQAWDELVMKQTRQSWSMLASASSLYLGEATNQPRGSPANHMYMAIYHYYQVLTELSGAAVSVAEVGNNNLDWMSLEETVNRHIDAALIENNKMRRAYVKLSRDMTNMPTTTRSQIDAKTGLIAALETFPKTEYLIDQIISEIQVYAGVVISTELNAPDEDIAHFQTTITYLEQELNQTHIDRQSMISNMFR